MVLKAVHDQVAALRNPPRELSDVLETLEKNGLVQSVAELRRLMS